MANPDTITIPLILPFDEAASQFLKRATYDDVGQRTSSFVFYSGRTDQDVAWSAVRLVQRQLADAGFNPR